MARSLSIAVCAGISYEIGNAKHVPIPQDYIYRHTAPPTTPTGIQDIDSFTISTWVDQTLGNDGAIFNFWWTASEGFGLFVEATTGELLVFNDNIDANDWIPSGVILPDGLHHVLFTCDVSTKKVRIVLDDTVDSGLIGYTETITNVNLLYFGQRGNGTYFYPGEIANVKVYEGVRSDKVITSLYHEFD